MSQPELPWPELPTPGLLIELPLALPPALCRAAGYDGGGRYLAMWWTPLGDELMLADGEVTFTGWWPASTLVGHPLGRVILSPYELGSSEREAAHWLLADRFQGTLHVGLALDVRQLHATQPSELAAAVEILGADHVQQLIQTHLSAPAGRPDPREVERQLERSRRLVWELAAWLDGTLTQLPP